MGFFNWKKDSQPLIEKQDPKALQAAVEKKYPSLKKFYYPLMPGVTISLTALFITLGALGILPLSTTILLVLFFSVDDFIMTPFIRLTKAFMNFKKQT